MEICDKGIREQDSRYRIWKSTVKKLSIAIETKGHGNIKEKRERVGGKG
jgi:hypothetical protein